jgi:prepilin-type N-terminal cleavage/methylation domain-containing protein
MLLDFLAMIRRSNKAGGNMRSQQGFTLIECVIAITIISIVIAIAIPSFQKYAINGNLKAATRDITSDFSSLKGRAIAENTTFSITFNVANNNYLVQQGGVTIQTKTPAYFARDIRITGITFPGSTITFQTRGTASAGTLNLINSRNSTAAITTNITGRTNVQFNMQ